MSRRAQATAEAKKRTNGMGAARCRGGGRHVHGCACQRSHRPPPTLRGPSHRSDPGQCSGGVKCTSAQKTRVPCGSHGKQQVRSRRPIHKCFCLGRLIGETMAGVRCASWTCWHSTSRRLGCASAPQNAALHHLSQVIWCQQLKTGAPWGGSKDNAGKAVARRPRIEVDA